jgi:ssDNA-binding Zn-finger/Zn-ribbon topoisomerase 1
MPPKKRKVADADAESNAPVEAAVAAVAVAEAPAKVPAPAAWTCAACAAVNNAAAAVCRDCGLERERSVVSAPEPSQAAATPVAAAAAAPERETLSRLCPNCSEKTLVERTSTKEPNAGRKFVSCLRDCGLFEWGDAEAYACPKCGCNRDTVKRAVKKEGRNHGRIFFGCATFPGGCGFFQWTEEFEKEPRNSRRNSSASKSARKSLSAKKTTRV